MGLQDTIQIDVSDTSGNSIDLSDFEAELLDQFGKSISVPVSAAAGHLTVKVLDQVSQGGAYTYAVHFPFLPQPA